MTIDRVATNQQTQFFLSQMNTAGSALDKTQQQIASGKVATTYAGFGDQTQVLQATICRQCAQHRLSDRHHAGHHPDRPAGHPAHQPVQPGHPVVTRRCRTRSPTMTAPSLMTQVQSIFDQATSILNSKDANGDYIYSGGKTDTPPVTVTSLSQLAALAVGVAAPSPMAMSRNRCRSPTAKPSAMASPPPISAPA